MKTLKEKVAEFCATFNAVDPSIWLFHQSPGKPAELIGWLEEREDALLRSQERVACAAPTEGGWYYGRFSNPSVVGDQIIPYCLVQPYNRLMVLRSGVPGQLGADPENYTWFGPVTTVTEKKQ